MERGKLSTIEGMFDHAQHTLKGEISSEKLNVKTKQIQQLDSFHLLCIVRYLQNGGGVNNA